MFPHPFEGDDWVGFDMSFENEMSQISCLASFLRYLIIFHEPKIDFVPVSQKIVAFGIPKSQVILSAHWKLIKERILLFHFDALDLLVAVLVPMKGDEVARVVFCSFDHINEFYSEFFELSFHLNWNLLIVHNLVSDTLLMSELPTPENESTTESYPKEKQNKNPTANEEYFRMDLLLVAFFFALFFVNHWLTVSLTLFEQRNCLDLGFFFSCLWIWLFGRIGNWNLVGNLEWLDSGFGKLWRVLSDVDYWLRNLREKSKTKCHKENDLEVAIHWWRNQIRMFLWNSKLSLFIILILIELSLAVLFRIHHRLIVDNINMVGWTQLLPR